MSSRPVRFRLKDGEALSLSDEEIDQVYELLWELLPKPGAVSTAAIVRVMQRESARLGAPMDLDAAQSAALREAVAQLRA